MAGERCREEEEVGVKVEARWELLLQVARKSYACFPI